MRRPRALLAAALLLLAPALCGAGWNPPGWEKPPESAPEVRADPVSALLLGGLSLYRSALGSVSGSQCPSWPSCSTFAVEAVRSEGPWLGSALTVARLLSEGNEGDYAGRIFAEGRWRYYDPVAREKRLLFSGGTRQEAAP